MIAPVIVIHGGAGTLSRSEMTTEKEDAVRSALAEALRRGFDVLSSSGNAVDAVQSAVQVLEDCPLFNAGRGSVFTSEGTNEMDASIMDGCSLKAGAVAGVRRIRNPILCARMVMDTSDHVLLTGSGAEKFAELRNVPTENPEYFFDSFRWQQLQDVLETEKTDKNHTKGKVGTVGAVALDMKGNLAAATSTGGMTNKRYGRVGDSPLIGCGTFADKRCAVSCTGHGEYFIRTVAAHSVAMAMEYGSMSVRDASSRVLGQIAAIGGTGGLIAVDANGEIALPFNTDGMYRGYCRKQGELNISIFDS